MVAKELILNRYKPLKQIGNGGFGTVHVAWDTRIQRKVAIKCIPLPEGIAPHDLSLAQSEAVDEHWMSDIPGLDEARTAALLQDQNIVAVYDFEIQDNTAYLIMEYVEGVTLTEILQNHDEDMSLDIIAAVFGDVAHALEIAHKSGVFHLDIKPDNVLINADGICKVTDFGLATLADAQGFGTAGAGTIGYMPPEQIRQESLDARCDEWALASIMYEMLSGNNPFKVQGLDRALDAIYDSELVLPSLCWEDIDPGIDDVVFRALDPDREERFSSVLEFARKLNPVLGDPNNGHRALRAIRHGQRAPQDDELAIEERKPRLSLSERIDTTFFSRMSHFVGLLGTFVISLVACMSVPEIGSTSFAGWLSLPMWGTIAVLCIIGTWKAHLGTLISLAFLGFVLCMNQAFALGIVLIAATGVWWFFIGRHGDVFANCALSFPLGGAIGIAPIGPLTCGYKLTLFDAVITTLFGIIVCFVFACLGTGNITFWNVFTNWHISASSTMAVTTQAYTAALGVNAIALEMLKNAQVWIIAAGWLLASVAMSLLCRTGKRALRITGAAVGGAIMIFSVCLGAFAVSAGTSWIPAWDAMIPTIVATVLLIAICALMPSYVPTEAEVMED